MKMKCHLLPNQKLAAVLCLALAGAAATFLSGCSILSAFSDGKKVRQNVQPIESAASPVFRQAAGSLLSGSFVPGNQIETLTNGDQIFPAMLQAIRGAKQTIDFETYVFWDGDIARQFVEALAERARAGVKVNAILDAQGTSKLGLKNLQQLREAGVDVEKYHSVLWWDVRRFNNRTHRKLLIVDGKVAFMGGVGIADEWTGHAQSPEHWRDNHYRVTGPVVAQIQGIFMDNWLKTRGIVLHGPEYFPALSPTGPYTAQAFKSSPRQGDIDMHLMYLLAIAGAQKTLRIENAYFLPDDKVREELIAAARRGVKVEIVVPGEHIDQKLVRISSRRHWPAMLKAGIKIYEYQPTMVHVKLMIVDDTFVSIGSGNFDNRSIRLNDEANLNVFDRGFAATQIRLFNQDRAKSRGITVDEAGGLIFTAPIKEVVGLTSSQL